MLHRLEDERVNCYSVLVEITVDRYLEIVQRAYHDKGGIEGQRAPLKTKTAVTIRNRLVADLKAGAIVPPLVIGMLLSKSDYISVGNLNELELFLQLVESAEIARISVIDGMQRTTAMLEAVESDADAGKRPIRVEFWIADQLNSLIYRMLVLNTGQVPWEISRQLETVYGQFLMQIREKVGRDVEIFALDEKRRRFQPGQYQSRSIIELLLLFSSRKSELDIRDRVAEDFARLDAIETTSHTEFLGYFITTLKLMSEIDRQFSRYSIAVEENDRLKSGKDIFSSFPAMVGFTTAVSIELFDEPGFRINWESAHVSMARVERSLGSLITRMDFMDEQDMGEFIQLQLLEEKLSARSGQVGRFERELFRRAFTSMIRNADRLENMAPCWMA